MLPCMCPVIYHRWRQNVFKTKKSVTDVLTTCPYVLCDLLLDRCTATWNLFVLYNKELNFVRIKAALFHVRRAKVGRSPFWKTRKKAIWRHLWSIQNEAIPLVAVRWQRSVIGLGKSRHCQTWLECRFSWNENLQRSKNWAAKSTILKENSGKVESLFVIRSAQ